MTTRQWVGATVFGCLVLPFFFLADEDGTWSVPQMSSPHAGPVSERLAHLQRLAGLVDGQRRRLLQLDEMERVAREPAGSMKPLTVDFRSHSDQPSVLEAQKRFETVVRSEIGEPKVPVGFFFVDRSEHALTDLEPWSGREGYLGDPEEPYCFSVIHRGATFDLETWSKARREGGPLGDPAQILALLGPCVLYAAHGQPGPDVEAWLVEGGHHHAGRSVSSDPWNGPRSFRGLFGRPIEGAPGLVAQRCAGGKEAACRTIFLDALEPARSQHFGAARVPPIVAFHEDRLRRRHVELDLLRLLLEDFGKVDFEAFWTSELPVEQAFEEAFAVTPSEWLRRVLVEQYGPIELGAGVSRANLGGSALFGLLCLVIATRLGRRRAESGSRGGRLWRSAPAWIPPGGRDGASNSGVNVGEV